MQSRFLTLAVSCLLWAGLACAQININTASQEELDGLKGIGEARAEAIIKYRSENGPFKSVNDLKNIPNFPDTLVGKLRRQITVGGGHVPAAEASKPKTQPVRPSSNPVSDVARPLAPAMPSKSVGKNELPAAPARPAMPGQPATAIKPAAPAAAAPATPAAPARPAMPGKVAAPAAPVVKPAGPAVAAPPPAVPGSKPATPAAPAKPAAPARPAMAN